MSMHAQKLHYLFVLVLFNMTPYGGQRQPHDWLVKDWTGLNVFMWWSRSYYAFSVDLLNNTRHMLISELYLGTSIVFLWFHCVITAAGPCSKQHNIITNIDTILYWCMPLTLLKLQVSLGEESLQCGHISSSGMFKSWGQSSVQSCAGIYLCLGCLFIFCTLSSFSLTTSSTYHLKNKKQRINDLVQIWSNCSQNRMRIERKPVCSHYVPAKCIFADIQN